MFEVDDLPTTETVSGALEKGGVQRTAQNFAQAFAELGHDSRVLALGGGPRRDELKSAGVPVSIGLEDGLLSEIEEWSPDLIHLHAHLFDPRDVRRVLDACPMARVIEKNVFSIPTAWSDRLYASHQLSDWCMRLYEERQSRQKVGAPAIVIPNPVNVRAFSSADAVAVDRLRTELHFSSDALILGRIGQAYLSKWSTMLIDIFEQLADDPRVHLLLVNPPVEVERRAARSAFADRVRSVQRIEGDENLRAAYSLMDVFVHIAEGGESFGNVLLESQLCGTPVVTFSTPWADNSQIEVVRNGVGGYVTTSRRGFIRAVRSLLEDTDRRVEMGLAGRAYAKKFDRLTVARAVIEVGVEAISAQRGVTVDDLIALYSDAFDPPSRTRRRVLRHPRLRLLMKYMSGLKPWRHLLSRPIVIPFRRLVRLITSRRAHLPASGAPQ